MNQQLGFNLLSLKNFGINLSLKDSSRKSLTDAKKKDIIIYNTKDEICGNYNDNLNLLELNDIILKKLNTENDIKRDEISVEIFNEEEKVRNPQSALDRSYSLRIIKNKKKELQDIIGRCDKYTKDVNPLLERYKFLSSDTQVKILGKEDTVSEKCISLIEEFILTANKYVKVNINRNFKYGGNVIPCVNCLTNINIDDINNESIITCPICYMEIPKLTRCYEEISSKETKTFITENQDEKNFSDAISKYSGIIHNPKLDTVDYVSLLDEYFKINSLLIGDEVKGDYLRHKGVYNKSLLKKALKATELHAFYSDMEYILHVYWGKKLDDISHLKDKLMEDYRISQPFYEKHKDPNKKSSMNVQYRLWRHLLKLGHQCDKSNFNIPTASFSYYESVWKKMCQDLGW